MGLRSTREKTIKARIKRHSNDHIDTSKINGKHPKTTEEEDRTGPPVGPPLDP